MLGRPRLLYLRTFRDDRRDMSDVLRMLQITHIGAQLVMIGSENEHTSVRDTLTAQGTVPQVIPKHILQFIESTDSTWKQTAIGEIIKADCIIMWLRPKEDRFPIAITPPGTVHDIRDFYKQPLSKTRTGAGLLIELAYLH